jgi:hypothetical protein
MKPKISESDFAALVAQSGLPLTKEQIAMLHEVYGLVEPMIARLTAPLPRESEPALIFVPEVR